MIGEVKQFCYLGDVLDYRGVGAEMAIRARVEAA